MITCPRDVLRDFAALVAAKVGAKVIKRKPVHLSGKDGGLSKAEIVEWVSPCGQVVGRKVTALDAVECWLEARLCTEVLIARADEVAERERVIAEVRRYAEATRRNGETQPDYVLSSPLLHAAARRNATLGRLFDQNSRGDRVRGNLAAALERAEKAGV